MPQRMVTRKDLDWLPEHARAGYIEMRSRVQTARFRLELALAALGRTEWPESDQMLARIQDAQFWLNERIARGDINKATIDRAEARLAELRMILKELTAKEAAPGREQVIKQRWEEAYAEFRLRHEQYNRLIRTCWEEDWMPQIGEETPEEIEARTKMLDEELGPEKKEDTDE